MRGGESEFNMRLLLEVERNDNPVEIVIHVNMLKEGWDVNNLYTIVPLRTAASKVLREQMVGRGLRLPYGERTNNPDVDAVMLTAHDKFQDILEEARKGDSIFHAGNVIHAEDIGKEKSAYTQMELPLENDKHEKDYEETGIARSAQTDELFEKVKEDITQEVVTAIQEGKSVEVTDSQKREIAVRIEKKITEDKDLGEIYKENENPLSVWMEQKIEKTHRKVVEKFISIPKIKITDEGVEEYRFVDFDLDLSVFKHVPIQNEMLIQNLEDMSDRERIKGDAIDFEGYNPKKEILSRLRLKSEIDYEKCSELLFKLITQLGDHYCGLLWK
jgi:type III restriction enzyme